MTWRDFFWGVVVLFSATAISEGLSDIGDGLKAGKEDSTPAKV